MKKILLLLLTIFLTLPVFLGAQSTAREIETLLETSELTWAQAARFALEASSPDRVFDNDEAFAYAQENGWLPRNAAADTSIRLDGLALLLVNAFEVDGGLMYRLFKNANFAYRELQYLNVIRGETSRSMAVSGEQFLFITERLSSLAESAEEEAARRRLLAEERAERRRLEAEARELRRQQEEMAAMIRRQVRETTTVEVTDVGITITLSNIQFLADSARLDPSEMEKLQEIADALKTIPDIKLLVAGHTALANTFENRQILSEQRARVVALYLVGLGACSAENITSVGYGAERPVATNNTPEGMAQNRRVEITILEN